MDKVADFFKDLKERISSPFFSSFLITWIVLNWQFLIAIFKFELNTFKLVDYKEYADYLNSLLNANTGFWYPLGIGLLYTTIYPLFRNSFEALQVWYKSWGNNWNIRISKKNKITIEKYMKLRGIYEERSNQLESIIEKESKTIERNEELINELNLVKQENNALNITLSENAKEISELKNKIILLKAKVESNNIALEKYLQKIEIQKDKEKVEFLNGLWKMTKTGLKAKPYNEERKVKFHDGLAYRIKENGVAEPWFNIRSYNYDSITNNIKIDTTISMNDKVMNLTLVPNSDNSILKGHDNIDTLFDITFEKITEN